MARVRRAEVRERVLAAAAGVFAEKGIAAARMADVAAAAGFTRGAVYSNFANKAELVAAVVDAASDRVAARGAAVFDPAVAPSALPDSLGALVAGGPLVDRRLALELAVQASRDPGLRATLAEPRRRQRRVVAEAITAYAAARGLTPPVRADVLAAVLLALVTSLTIERLVDPDGLPAEALRHALAPLLPA
ncbi:TetR family transcriptional regulator [Actinokineospora pegani]|uniref:TetR family transcriptional regulator n=1 Tax=Actinokineospora pegani TaxID=2654637 RepID=UPI0012EA7AF8|nr:TetR family transcriptional regulator [Actinokineospora pegani]